MLLIIIAIIISLALAIYVWQHRFATGAYPLLALSLAVFIWSIGYSQELRAADLSTVYLWAKIEYFGIVTMPVAWFYLALEYSGRHRWLNRRTLFLTNLIPLLTLLAVWFADQLIWQTATLVKVGSFSVFDPTYNFWFWIHFAYSTLLLIAGTILFAQAVIRSYSVYRWQALLLLLALASPWVGNLLYLSGQSQLDLTPFAFSFSLIAFTWSILRFKLLDITPIARNLVIETMPDMVIILNTQDRIVDLNEAARKLIGRSTRWVIGRSINNIFARWEQDFQSYQDTTEASSIITIPSDDKILHVELMISPIQQADRLLGSLLLLRDVTDYTQVDTAYQETFKQLQARTLELETLHQMGLDLAATLNLDEVLETIMLATVNLLEAEAGALFFYQSENDNLKLAANFNLDLPLGYEMEPGQGLSGRVWQLNQPLVIDSYQPWEGRIKQIETTIGDRSSMAVPIGYGEEKVGVLAVSAQVGRVYTRRDVDLLTLFMPSAALAIHNARLYQQGQAELAQRQQTTMALHRQNEYLEALHQISLDLLNHRQEQSLLQSIVERTAELFEAAYCTLVLQEEKELLIRATTHKHVDQIGSPVIDYEGMVGRVFATGQPLVLNEYANWEGKRASLAGLQLQTAVAVPIIKGQQCIGALGLARADADQIFDSGQVYMLTLLAQLAALVLQQAQLYEAIQRELSERRQAEDGLRESEEWLRSIIASMDDLVFVLDRQGIFLDYYQPNQKVGLYLPPEHFLGKSYIEVLPPPIVEGLTTVLQRVTQSGEVEQFEYALPSNDQKQWYSANISGRNDRHGQFDGVTVVVRNITEYKQASEQLRQFALYDELTGLPNRRLLMEKLDSSIEQKQQQHFALLFLDLDRFKIINDSLGHQVGDVLLIAIARLLESCVRQHDTVARLGGDEFVVLLSSIHNEAEAQQVAERILDRMARPFFLLGHTIYTSASIGLIAQTTHYEHPDEVLRHADIAMYQAKQGGKARYELFDLSQQDHAADLWQIESDLRRALEQGELVVYYQPIVSLGNGRITAVEALVRWQHPQRGLLDPSVFLSVAEEAGLIVAVNQQVLQQACQQLQVWHQAGYDSLRLTVNVSAVQLQQVDAITFIQDVLRQTDLLPHMLGLEITERFSARTREHVPTLTALHNQGIGLLIDDFGIGSSLESLKLFPLDYLKINQTFVQGMTRDSHDRAIITAMIAMAHSLGLEVIAEGVETAEQLAYLQTEGCDEVQGYFIASPMSANDMSLWLRQKEGHTLDIDSPSKSLDLAIRAHFAEHIGYALVDSNLTILKSNDTMRQWIEGHVDRPDEQLVTDAFPVLIGLEEAMSDLIGNVRAEPLVLSRIFCPGADEFGRYYNLRVETFAADTAVLLLIAQDVTREARQEFALRQQLNELRLTVKA